MHLLKRSLSPLLIALAPISLMGPTSLVVVAAPASAQQSDAAYLDLYKSMDEGVDHEAALNSTMIVVQREYSSVPIFAQLEKESPGLIEDLVANLRPVFRDYQERVRLLYRPRIIDLFDRTLTPAEAIEIAAFYRSPLGQRILGSVSKNYSPDATLEDVLTVGEQSNAEKRAKVSTDLENATTATVEELSRAELAEIGRKVMANPALLKMEKISSQVVSIRTEMEQEPLTAEEQTRIEGIVEEVIRRRLGQ